MLYGNLKSDVWPQSWWISPDPPALRLSLSLRKNNNGGISYDTK